jgi:ABC-type uncharacterized transport system substrate-binding protein
LQQATRSAAIVFADVGDPVGQRFVETLARPGGNTTGFMLFESAMGGKWLELLKEIAPGVTRVAVLRDTASTVAGGQLGAIQAAAAALGVELSPLGMRDAGEVKRSISTIDRVTGEASVFFADKTISGTPLSPSLFWSPSIASFLGTRARPASSVLWRGQKLLL